MNRRLFMANSALLGATTLSVPSNLFTASAMIKKVGVQLYTLPKLLDADFKGAITMLAKLGYKEVELFGPYPFSSETAQKGWEQAKAYFGLNGSGFFGHTPKEIKAIVADAGMTIPSLHTDFDTLNQSMDKLVEAAHALGTEYIVLPSIPDKHRKTPDDYKKTAEAMNKWGAVAKTGGVKFGYHNHGYGWKAVDGKRPIDLIFEGTDKSLVFFEMDLFWTTAAGINPVEQLKKESGRYHLMHVKDASKAVHFKTDGNSPMEWVELFSAITTVGSGVMDMKNILSTAKAQGVKHFFVEQDNAADPGKGLKTSFDYIKGLKTS